MQIVLGFVQENTEVKSLPSEWPKDFDLESVPAFSKLRASQMDTVRASLPPSTVTDESVS